ncbi:hypothetical protein NQ314_008876 [Rhamnusium bicolor]|uniref:Uncharacterized protein n=1 Tax=Rhamnusium bicolor TaxID=1586634 RepID=A0AAV8Y7Z3_9CUCU|nr:hypothetical protein NQ314_008876 [Rhamnusium bicolor]
MQVYLFYFIMPFLTHDSINQKYLKKNARKDIKHVRFISASVKKRRDYNIWLIFTKVTNVSTLSFKFRDLIHNLLNVTSVPLKFNIIVDRVSQGIAENQISDVVFYMNKSLVYSFYDIEESAKKIQDIVEVMTPYFSSKPGK